MTGKLFLHHGCGISYNHNYLIWMAYLYRLLLNNIRRYGLPDVVFSMKIASSRRKMLYLLNRNKISFIHGVMEYDYFQSF
jgi:hypothetical protein